ncbi:hypothetical protein E3O45_08160 [Cryobacterium sp. TMS1-20-1]|uniref:hypothetical protein n=1 Tax=Cryobacterium sp. TMS1-20-1 TaxID=1259223 RepID=UPI00106C450A|nr:hypothetical protein [Cryobacterium sp. TMS1-20-1]TFC76725.1 hypothetical protein E3O45_08160 [Cryobacterium sp. TMS1-20-1]
MLVLGLAGCAGAVENEKVAQPTQTADASAELCNPASDSYGDSVADSTVTDDLGTYCRTVINPNADAIKEDVSKYDRASLTQYAISDDDALAFQRSAVEFLGSEGLDSSALDTNTDGTVGNDTAGQAWVEQNLTLFDPGWSDPYTAEGGLYSNAVVVNGYTPALIRDGGPRLVQSSITVTSVYAGPLSRGTANQVIVTLNAKASYRAIDADTVAFQLRYSPEKTKKSVQAEHPELFDGTGENNIFLDGTFTYAYSTETRLLVGNRSNYEIDYKARAGL